MGNRLPFWVWYTINYVRKNDGGELTIVVFLYNYGTFAIFMVIS